MTLPRSWQSRRSDAGGTAARFLQIRSVLPLFSWFCIPIETPSAGKGRMASKHMHVFLPQRGTAWFFPHAVCVFNPNENLAGSCWITDNRRHLSGSRRHLLAETCLSVTERRYLRIVFPRVNKPCIPRWRASKWSTREISAKFLLFQPLLPPPTTYASSSEVPASPTHRTIPYRCSHNLVGIFCCCFLCV